MLMFVILRFDSLIAYQRVVGNSLFSRIDQFKLAKLNEKFFKLEYSNNTIQRFLDQIGLAREVTFFHIANI